MVAAAGGGSLAHVIVQNGAGHVAIDDILDSLAQCVNTDQIDVLADGTASLLQGLQSAQCHCVVVAEDDFDLLAVLCQSVCDVLLCGGLVPVVQVLVQALDFLAGVGQSLDGVLGAVLSINVLGVALAHDVGDLAVAVDVALSLGLEDQLALISTGLTCVSADVAALVCVGVQNALVRLTVDEDDGSLRGLDGINDGLSGSGLDGVG